MHTRLLACVGVAWLAATHAALGAEADEPRAKMKTSITELIARLKNANAAPVVRDETGTFSTRLPFPREFDWKAQETVLDAWRELHSRCDEALPELVRHVDATEYSITYQSPSGFWRNGSVGFVCQYIIRANIEPYRRPYLKSKFDSFLLSFDKGSSRTYTKAIAEWWKDRSEVSMRDMQIESIEWQIAGLKASAKPVERLDALVERLEELKSQLTKEGHLIRTVSWHHGDELNFRHYPVDR